MLYAALCAALCIPCKYLSECLPVLDPSFALNPMLTLSS